MTDHRWRADDIGLDPISQEVAARGSTVHLRLHDGLDHHKAACVIDDERLTAQVWGQLWSGKGSEVTCPSCLQAVHA